MSTPRNTPNAPSPARHTTRARQLVTGLLAVAVASTAVACAEGGVAPTEPAAEVQAPVGRTAVELNETRLKAGVEPAYRTLAPVVVKGLRWLKPAGKSSVSKVIGPRGGSLDLPGGGKLVVPAGAVTSNVTFTGIRVPGPVVAYDFQPAGARFSVPLTVEVPLGLTEAYALITGSTLQGAYFPSDAALDPTTGTATVTEFQPTVIDWRSGTVSYQVTHFSGYIMTTGRTSTRTTTTRR